MLRRLPYTTEPTEEIFSQRKSAQKFLRSTKVFETYDMLAWTDRKWQPLRVVRYELFFFPSKL